MTDERDDRAAWKADHIEPAKFGKWEISKFTVNGRSLADMRYAMQGRGCRPGEYTMLRRNGTIVMSDTTAEYRDHLPLFYEVYRPTTRRVLMAGCGLGCALRVVLNQPTIEHVDVVDIDSDIINNVGKRYHDDPRVSFHEASIFDIEWPKGYSWDAAWFDIWDYISAENLPEMNQLSRKYAKRAPWRHSWGLRDTRKLNRDSKRLTYY